MKHDTINRRQAITAVAGAAIAGAASPAVANSADPIVAMFAERNRLFLAWLEATNLAEAERERVVASSPPRPDILMKAPPAAQTPETMAAHYASLATMFEAVAQWEAECKAALAVRYHPLEDANGAACRAWADMESQISEAVPVSPEGLAIKAWIAVQETIHESGGHDINDLWGYEGEFHRPALQTLHDLTRFYGLRVVGYSDCFAKGDDRDISSPLLAYVVGSDRGEHVERPAADVAEAA